MNIIKKWKRLAVSLLAAALLLQAGAFAVSGTAVFPDVKEGAWYTTPLDLLLTYTPGIISGCSDGTFSPDKTLTRGEFIKILAVTGDEQFMMLSGDDIPYDPTPKEGQHWAAPFFGILNKYNVFAGLDVTADYPNLSTPITRYEMAVMVENFLINVMWESDVKAVSPEKVIADYSSIPSQYRSAVVQVYGKGIISGFSDGAFHGSEYLTRAQVCSVVKQILWSGDRKLASFVDTSVQTPSEPNKNPNYVPVAIQYVKNGWVSSGGSVKSSKLYEALMGSASKTYFTSSTDAANYMKTVTVPVWKINSKTGEKYASTTSITINKALADDIVSIFTQIYNDPEKFPMESVGGARYTDTMRHSWGAAIDINPYYNAECRAYYNSDGSINRVVQTCGYGWWPVGTEYTAFAGKLGSPSAYSIGSGSSVVKAFKDYGWGWAGNGYSVNNGSQKFDYMHFSILPNGG